MKSLKHILLIILSLNVFVSCKKSSFLDKRPDESIILPNTPASLQAILDNYNIMNGNSSGQMGVVPAFGEAGADDYYLIDIAWNELLLGMRNLYLWNDDIYNGVDFYDWDFAYRAIFYSNVVIEGAANMKDKFGSINEYNNVRGSALFYRSQMFFQLCQVFSPVYDKKSSSNSKGIVLRMKSDINEPLKRATLQESYDQCLKDLKEAIQLLPSTPLYKTRPSKAAGYGLLARIYLNMNEYDSANVYSSYCLGIANKLINYNNIDPNESYPFSRYNDEVIFHSMLNQVNISTLFHPSFIRVDSTLFQSYSEDDLRKSLYYGDATEIYGDDFGTGKFFRGSYDNSELFFAGIAVDEILLTRAECLARLNKVKEATEDLNKLLFTRFKEGTYVPFETTDQKVALDLILKERRKELVFRGLRWSDLRRLNKDGSNIFVKRIVGNKLFELAPNDPRYVYLIPPTVIRLNANIEQNSR